MIRLYTDSIAETIRDSRDHTVRFPFAEVVYWEGNSAAHHGDNWTRVQIKRGQFPQIELDLKNFRDRKHLISFVTDTLRLLHAAYEQGAKDQNARLRELLDVPRDTSFGPR